MSRRGSNRRRGRDARRCRDGDANRPRAIDGRHAAKRVPALAYLVNENHPQFAGRLPILEQVALVSGAKGESGRNTEYVRNTAEHLLSLGIRDKALDAIVAALDGDERLMVRSA